MVSDGDQPAAVRIVREEGWSAVRYFTGPRTQCWGNAQRTEGINQATGDYLLFIDDDDVYRRDAFRSLRQATSDSPDRIVIFRMKRFDGTLWQRPVIEYGQVATPQFVVPNLAGKIGSWLTQDRYESDFDFIGETIELQGEPIWDEHVISTIEPFDWRHPGPWVRVRRDNWRVSLRIRTRLRRL